MRRAALLLVLLLAPGVLAQAPQGRPSLTILDQPTFTVGDYWTYRGTIFGTNNTTAEETVTVRVEAFEPYNGTEAIRLHSEAVQDSPPAEDGTTFKFRTNRTIWLSQRGHSTLAIREEGSTIQELVPHYRITTTTRSNWTFHRPMDAYQYPILRDDAWVIVLQADVERSTQIVTDTVNRTSYINRTPTNGTVDQESRTVWLRQDVCPPEGPACNEVGTFDVVVLQTLANGTVFEFWAPAAGNVVRREVLNQRGQLQQVSVLTDYRFQHPPTLRPAVGGEPAGFGVGLLPIAAAAVLGAGAAVGAVHLARKRAAQRNAGPGDGSAPEAGPGDAGSEEPSGRR